MSSRTRDEWFDVDVAFVDRKQQVLFGTILGGNRETAGEVGEDSIASEFGRGLDAAAENSVREIVRVVVVQGFSQVKWWRVKGLGRQTVCNVDGRRSGGVGRGRGSRAGGADVGSGSGDVA
jgi:hypothetical protein